MPIDYTPSQYDAIHTHDCNLIVTAGAGSGKTRVLVDRFINMLNANPDWPLSSLVAITFTEKAAREMRDRVRQAIEQCIIQATEARSDPDIQHWRKHEAALDSARIGTIHSLCAAILRANAAEVEIDPRFDVLDEIEAALVRNEAIEQALAQLATDDTARLLVEYGLTTVREILLTMLGSSIEFPPGPYLDSWTVLYEQVIKTAFDQLRQDGDFADAVQWQPPDGWPQSSDKLLEAWDVVSTTSHDMLSPDTPVPDAIRALERLSTEIDLRGGSAKVWGSKQTLDRSKGFLRFIRQRAQKILDNASGIGDADKQADELLPLWAAAVACAQTIYATLKHKRHALDFEDLEALTRRVLHHESVAGRYRGAEFRHILVDEFQDTNGAQRDIIYALAGLDRPGSLFVVGDPRQSIYAFRGADVSVFQQVREEILARGGREITLDTSFRSHARLVAGFNAIFSRLLVRSGGPTAGYEVDMGQPMIAYRQAEPHHSPTLEVIVIDKQYVEDGSADNLRRWEAWELAQRLREMVTSGWPIWDKQTGEYRPIQYGDMAVLFQATRNMPLVEDIFKAADIPYVTVAGKGYYNRPEVWDLLNLLKALYNPLDNLSLAAALRSPLYNLSDDDLFALRLQEAQPASDGSNIQDGSHKSERLSLWTVLMDAERVYDPALSNPDQVAFVRGSLGRLYSVAGRVTVAELLSKALDETAYLATLSGVPDGSRRCANVDKLMEVARRSGRIALGAFTEYLQDLVDREAREGEAVIAATGAVHLMTVHASKGLEFPLVALFDASWERINREPALVIDPLIGPTCCVMNTDRERVDPPPFAYHLAQDYAQARHEAERIRLLYVGMTRAQDYVIVSGRRAGKRHWLSQLIETLKLEDLPGGTQLRPYDWGNCLLRVPTTPPDPVLLIPRAQPRSTGWDQLSGALVPDVAPYTPPLLAPIPVDRYAPTRIMNATEIAALGEARAFKNPAQFRNRILHDAPTAIREVAEFPPSLDIPQHIIGNIVHEALRWWHLPGNTPERDLRDILDSYAWEQGITDPQMVEEAIQEATRLLRQTEESEIVQQIAQASQVYRELPFTFRLGERTINGVIDVLFFSKYQRWHVVDYKTSAVHFDTEEEQSGRIWGHAKRYHAQIGIYAAAVEALTGQTPDAHLHYIRYVHTVKVPAAIWKAVLQSLDDDIASALEDG